MTTLHALITQAHEARAARTPSEYLRQLTLWRARMEAVNPRLTLRSTGWHKWLSAEIERVKREQGRMD